MLRGFRIMNQKGNAGLFLLVFVFAFLSLKGGKEFSAGCILGIGLLRYEITLPLLLFFLVARRWRVLAGSIVSGSLLIIASFVIVGRDFIPQYVKMCEYLSVSHSSAGSEIGRASCRERV